MQLRSIRDFQGLNVVIDMGSSTRIAALIGRNGAGKTRLLQAISQGHIEVQVDGFLIPQNEIRLHTVDQLLPGLVFGFDPVQHRENVRQAVALYKEYKGRFTSDPVKTASSLGSGVPLRGRNMQVGLLQVAQAAARASQILSKNINDLSDSEIADFFSGSDVLGMGALNVTATMRAYWDRMEMNEFHEFRNERHKENLPYFSPEEFRKRFGPPPWIVLNSVLRDVLDGKYYFEEPNRENIAGYNGSLFRSVDGLLVEPSWLSSGEKVLMWLCLSMYATTTRKATPPPKLILLDEPDSVLHPQMMQKLHMVLTKISTEFHSNIIFTSHSPTSIALFNSGSIWQVSEQALSEIPKDAAISELLVGLDQVHVHFTKCKQVYVESHKDEELYQELFTTLRRCNKGLSEYTNLSFIPAAPKLPETGIRDLLRVHFDGLDCAATEAFIKAVNGQGNCVQVIGAVESLNKNEAFPVYGIIDWDLRNKPRSNVHVFGEGLFYSIENAVINPVTLGFYLLRNFTDRLSLSDYGLHEQHDPLSLYSDSRHWQSIADGVMRRVLKVKTVNHDIQCKFLSGSQVFFDKRYSHMNGHDLEELVRDKDVYPFLNSVRRRPSLMMDIVKKEMQMSHGRTMPQVFADIFCAIQTTSA